MLELGNIHSNLLMQVGKLQDLMWSQNTDYIFGVFLSGVVQVDTFEEVGQVIFLIYKIG